jgi:hypothetical protein
MLEKELGEGNNGTISKNSGRVMGRQADGEKNLILLPVPKTPSLLALF